MTALAEALADAGGADAPRERHARLGALLRSALRSGAEQLTRTRSGRDAPVEVAVAAEPGRLLAAAPVPAALRADPAVASGRPWALVAALVGAVVQGAELPAPAGPTDLALAAGELDGFLVLALPARDADLELVALAFAEEAGRIDRLRTEARELPAALLASGPDPRPPVGSHHPLRVAEAIARLGGSPVDAEPADALEGAVAGVLGPAPVAIRPHDDPDPARRAARRILQRLAGMGKWGGYHTEWDHLARGFEGNERELAYAVGEQLLAAGLLAQKPSVGQRHVYLDPRRAGDVHRLIEDGTLPPGLVLDVTR